MRLEQFQALARLAGMRPGSGAYLGALAHLVNCTAQNKAAETLGITAPTVSQAVARIRRAEIDAIRATR